jgi:predicted secreted protein
VSWPLSIALYFTVWWVVLFAVLPFGVRSQHEDGDITPGTDPGAPVAPKLGWKILWTTIISALLWGAVMLYLHRS